MKPADISMGLKLIISKIEEAEIPYMIVGSVAGVIYGEPRLTNDVDLVLSMSGILPDVLIGAFDKSEFYVPPYEILSHEITRGGQTNLIHHISGVKADLMFRKQNPHALEEFSRRRRIEILRGLTAWIAAPEDVIIAKLRFFREGESQKHLLDIRGILANTEVDRSYLDRWIKSLDLEKYFAMV